MSAASIFGRILPTFLARRFGVFNMGILFVECMGILIYAMLGISNAGGLVVFSVIYGFFSGGGMIDFV
jgi:hypothetical protein